MIERVRGAGAARRTSPLFRLGVAVLILAFASLTTLAAARSRPGDAVILGMFGVITVAAVHWGERFLSRWVQRRDGL